MLATSLDATAALQEVQSSAAHLQTDGYRNHSDAERNNLDSKVGITLPDDRRSAR